MPLDMLKLRALQPPNGLPFKIRRLGHVVLQVADLGRSLVFYTQALGFKVTKSIPRISSPVALRSCAAIPIIIR
jgi:catechol-2,3-dioxygenase